MPSRSDEIGAFYAEKAGELHRAIRRAVTGPDARVEDACSIAWCLLLEHDEVDLGGRGFSWLYVVALREAYRLSGRARREPALGTSEDLPQHHLAGDVVQERERLALLARLPERQRRMVYLHAFGFRYADIAAITGDTLLTVERQLLRGKRALRRIDREQAA